MVIWADASARARGLARGLADRPRLEALARAENLRALASRWEEAGRAPAAAAARRRGPGVALDRASRASIARRLAILARWLGRRTERLAVAFEDEDRRSLRALLRGAAEGVPAELRLAGLVPTPGLPEEALRAAATAASPAAALEPLRERGHPLVPPAGPALGSLPAELFDIQLEIDRRFAHRAMQAAGRARSAIGRFARETIDLENVWTALLWPGDEAEPDGGRLFLPGGERLGRDAFDRALAAVGLAERRRIVADALARGPLAPALADPAVPVGLLEARALAARIEAWTRRSRVEPLGAAPLLLFFLRLRAEAMDLRRIVWGIAMDAPASVVGSEWVTG